MLPPSNRSITIALGGTALVGRTTTIVPPVQAGAPAWLTAANPAIGQWIEIPGTVMPSKVIAESFSGMTTTPSGKIIAALNGGHTDGAANDTYGIDLAQNAPAWSDLCPASPTLVFEQPYQPDGKPAARHNYYAQQYMSAINSIVMVGCVFTAQSGNSSFPTIDAFKLSANTWDAAGVWPYCGTTPYPGPDGSGNYPGTGNSSYYPGYSGYARTACGSNGVDTILVDGGLATFNVLTKAFSATISTGLDMPRAPWAYDTTRQEYFGMCYGDNQAASTFLGIVAVRRNGNTLTKITFNASAAVAALAAEVPEYAAMAYDPVNDQYLFRGTAAGAIYVIKPNSGSVWDISVLPTTGSIVATHSSGLNNRFQYIAALKGVVCAPATGSGVFFMRTA